MSHLETRNSPVRASALAQVGWKTATLFSGLHDHQIVHPSGEVAGLAEDAWPAEFRDGARCGFLQKLTTACARPVAIRKALIVGRWSVATPGLRVSTWGSMTGSSLSQGEGCAVRSLNFLSVDEQRAVLANPASPSKGVESNVELIPAAEN